MRFLKHNFGGILGCLLEALVGILLLMNPIGFTSGIIIVAGLVMMLVGLASVINYFRTDPYEASRSQTLVKGLIALLAGAFCAFQSGWFLVTFPVITLIYGVVILLTGLAKFQWMVDCIRMTREKWFFPGISALLSIVCGVVIIGSPFSSTAILWMFTGISLLIEAIFDVIALILGNKEKRTSEDDEIEEDV